MKHLKTFEELKSVTQVAMRDMAEDKRKRTGTKWTNSEEQWDVNVKDVFSPDSKKKNKELGIHKVNKTSDLINNVKRIKKKKKKKD